MSKSKILVIGQAPPDVKQDIPYSTTMLYNWLEEINISKDRAQSLFEFEAVYNNFPGRTKSGSHKKSSKKQMEEYWKRTLHEKVKNSSKIWLLGNCSKSFFYSQNIDISNKIILETIHPSFLNFNLYQKNKDTIITKINLFIHK